MLPQRKDLIAYLESADAPRPARVDGGSKPEPGAGFVTANFDEGYVILVPQGERPSAGTNLVWQKDDREKRRPLAPGAYEVRRYVIARRDAKGVEWNLWATGNGREVAVRSGEETKLTLDLEVTVTTMAALGKGKVAVGGAFRGENNMGLSLVRGQARVPVPFRVIVAGKEVGGGEGIYG